MRPQLTLILALNQADLEADPQGGRYWHSIRHLGSDEIRAAIKADWLERSATKDFVRLTGRGQMVARQHMRTDRNTEGEEARP